MLDMAPERLTEIEEAARCYPTIYRQGANCADTLALCAALRAAWAEREALRSDVERLTAKVEAMREGMEALRQRAPEAESRQVLADVVADTERRVGAERDALATENAVLRSLLEGLRAMPEQGVYARLDAERLRVCEAAKRWLSRAREAKRSRDIGQDDWYCAYAEDASALMEAADALEAAEAATKGSGER